MLLALSSIIILSFILIKWPFFKLRGIPISALITVFIIKCFAGFLSFTYHNYYFAGGDSAIYIQGGYDLITYSEGNPITYLKLFLNLNRNIPEWENIYSQIIYWDSKSHFNIINDNRNAIRLNSLVSLISFQNTYVHIIILNFLSIIGLSALYKSFTSFFQKVPPLVIFTAVFLSPSILFWTSGILKETHTVLIVGLFFLVLSKWIKTKQIKYIASIILLAFLLILVRTYFSLIILFATIIFLLLNSIQYKKAFFQLLITGFFITGIALIVYLLPINLFEIIKAKQNAFIDIGSNANSFFQIATIDKPIDILLLFPSSIINVFIQPQLFSFDSYLYIFSIIENIDIFFLCYLAIRYYKPIPKETMTIFYTVLLVYLLSSWLIGLTVPIQGAIARYKAITQPFLLISILSLINWEKLKENYLPVRRLL